MQNISNINSALFFSTVKVCVSVILLYKITNSVLVLGEMK